MNEIGFFRDRYAFLSNFHRSSVQVVLDGLRAPTVEHAYQAAKTMDTNERVRIVRLPTPAQAKKAGRDLQLRPDWNEVRDDVMLELVVQKFVYNPCLASLLRETGDAELIEGNYWHDNYWGRCFCGKCPRAEKDNQLGRILMDVRAVVR